MSVSVDSKLCLWHFGELSNPKISFYLFNQNLQKDTNNNESKYISVSSMDFPEEETDKFFVGSEDYNIY